MSDMLCRSRISAAGMLLGLVSLGGASSCLFHSSDRCDDDQTYDSAAGLCVCDPKQNRVTGDHGCVACGAHEVAENDTCGCEEGYKRPSSGAACTLVPEALGGACESDKDCTDSVYDTCHIVSGGASYCTNVDCDKDQSACTGGYACNDGVSPSYCQRPPAGAGQSCGSDKDCQGTDATYCEIYVTHVCHVEGCSLTSNDCFPGQECCDLSIRSGGLVKKQICVDSGTCTK
jgi:hypothetical protein